MIQDNSIKDIVLIFISVTRYFLVFPWVLQIQTWAFGLYYLKNNW